MKFVLALRRGFSMLEVILFIGILAIIMGTVIAVVISTNESRIRQRSVAEVEQRGTQLLETLSKNIRRAEAVLIPIGNLTGSILALQTGLNAEFPTILTSTSTGGLLLIQKNDVFQLLGSTITISNLTFRNIGNTNVTFGFDLHAKIPLVTPVTYTRHFDGTATLFPDDQSQAGGCGSCAAPSCVSHQYQWYQCEADTCTLSTSTFAC